MLNRKLLEVLVRFTIVQHKEFRLFLQSPYFVKTSRAPKLLELYDYIAQNLNSDEHHKLEKK